MGIASLPAKFHLDAAATSMRPRRTSSLSAKHRSACQFTLTYSQVYRWRTIFRESTGSLHKSNNMPGSEQNKPPSASVTWQIHPWINP